MQTKPIIRWVFDLSDEPGASAKGYDDSAWRSVVVPHDWSVEQDFSPSASSGTGYLPGGVGWYRAHVQLPDLGQHGIETDGNLIGRMAGDVLAEGGAVDLAA